MMLLEAPSIFVFVFLGHHELSHLRFFQRKVAVASSFDKYRIGPGGGNDAAYALRGVGR